MPVTWVSNIEVSVKGASGQGNQKQHYTVNIPDEMTLMTEAMHVSGLQSDILSINRAALQSGMLKEGRKPGGISLTITVQTKDSNGTPWQQVDLQYLGLEQAGLDAALAAIQARLTAVGATP